MKYSILAIIAMFIAFGARADEKSGAMLAELHKKVASWGDYRVDFAVTVDGESIRGSFEVSGQKYHVTTPAMEIFCDGTTRWEVNNIDSEVVIDRVDPADRTVMGNPTRLFDFMDGAYTHRYVGVAMVNGVNCERVEISEKATAEAKGGRTAAEKSGVRSGSARSAARSAAGSGTGTAGSGTGSTGSGSAVQTIDLFVATATGLPVRVGYTIGFMNTEAAVDVVNISPRVTLAPAAFSYDPKRYTGYEVIDFR